MPEHHFETPGPVDLLVEIGKRQRQRPVHRDRPQRGRRRGPHADDVVVEQRGSEIRVVEPHRTGGLFRDTSLRVHVTVPLESNPGVRTGSADVDVTGRAGHAQLRSGSGTITTDELSGHVLVETGSGDVRLGEVVGNARVKSGSGDLVLGRSGGDLSVSTGSGDVRLEETYGATVVKTGSGDLEVRRSHGDVSWTTGSGDLAIGQVHRGRVSVKAASGDVRVGVTPAVPVWTDITTVTGTISSGLQGAGQPQEGQDHIEVRARTVSGDITLREV